MSKNNNIASDDFKVGGAGHSGAKTFCTIVNKRQYTQAEKVQEENAALTPNQHEHNESRAARGDKNRDALIKLVEQ